MPSGAFVGGGVLLGTVDAKPEVFVIGATSSAGEDQAAFVESAPRSQRLIC
jgi:hypothetical protein